jgi:hypothetical protein
VNSLLSLILLGESSSAEDEMRARPTEDGSYGPLDEILARFAREVAESDSAPPSSAGRIDDLLDGVLAEGAHGQGPHISE